jgi:hypothetical protein
MLIKIGGVDESDLRPVCHADLVEMVEDYFDGLPEEDIDPTFVSTRTDDNEIPKSKPSDPGRGGDD